MLLDKRPVHAAGGPRPEPVHTMSQAADRYVCLHTLLPGSPSPSNDTMHTGDPKDNTPVNPSRWQHNAHSPISAKPNEG